MAYFKRSLFTPGHFWDVFPGMCKLCKLALYITTYFGHGECYIWEFLVLAFIESARLSTTSFSIFSWSGNDTVLVSKSYMPSLYVKTLLDMSNFLNNIYIDRCLLLLALIKYIWSQICSHELRTALSGDCGNRCFWRKYF